MAQQQLTAPEASQGMPRSPARKIKFESFLSVLSRLKLPRPSDFVQVHKTHEEKEHSIGEKSIPVMGTFFSKIGTLVENCLKP